jgi:YhcH/YjgK/YiaL family protein
MIIDKITNAHLYMGLGERLQFALNYIAETDFSSMETGKFELDGDNVFVLVNEYQTKENEQNIMEAHRKYIDLQYVVKGTEIVEFESFHNQDIVRAYDAENDYIFYTPKKRVPLQFNEKMFAIFFPEDLHMPGIMESTPVNIKKIVVKILID